MRLCLVSSFSKCIFPQTINQSNIRLLTRRITRLTQTQAGFTEELGVGKVNRLVPHCTIPLHHPAILFLVFLFLFSLPSPQTPPPISVCYPPFYRCAQIS